MPVMAISRRKATAPAVIGHLTVCLALAAGVLAGGCAKRHKSEPMASADDVRTEALDQERQRFESMRDPPLTADTHYAAGQLAEAHGSPAQSIQQYQRALKIDPDHLPSLYRLGVIHARLKQYDDAIAVWQRYVKASRESAVAYSNLGLCYEFAGRSDQAERAYQRGIERDSASGPCRVNYGIMLARHGRTNEAIFQFQAVLSPAEVHYNLASVFEGMGRLDDARLEYRKAIELNPRMADAVARLNKLEQPAAGARGGAAMGGPAGALAGEVEPAP